MATIQQKVVEKFLAKLTNSKDVDPAKVEELRVLLADDKKPKADDFMRIFSLPAGADLK